MTGPSALFFWLLPFKIDRIPAFSGSESALLDLEVESGVVLFQTGVATAPIRETRGYGSEIEKKEKT
ncbi:hypothetical protein AKJ51_01645 [candidate division MSBL1 archaeon SCGC-AAA382A20]|uniref:Uncharacterized protein n=1 Tax=candidate division MSBL1 archaeon SCGC-AAA382A20 TaxID=1698280 RepID=A0A133VLI5_9EURY|nr:hypothetical protein AKJ51_01645 [candidate division MSBL1 archaeon SCGC-AAA382A20]